jgi:2-iminobutanoate/2-iminopropanoate deaminase
MVEAFDVPGMQAPVGIYSTAVWAPPGRTLYISGQTATTETGFVGPADVKEQTRQTLDNLKRILEHAGGGLADIVSVTVYVTSMSYFRDIHEVRAQYFSKPYPASTLVQVVALAHPALLVEIDAVAVIPARG